jgi:acetaldehyde dehydrogenase (acetylating)
MKSESISTNLEVCVVGAGKMGADHIERLTGRIDGAEVSVVVDADLSRAQKAVEAIHSAVAVSNIGQALDREDVDAVLIATPGFLHRDMLLQVLERDLPILCEKPLTPAALLGNLGSRAATWKETDPGWLYAPLRCGISAPTRPHPFRRTGGTLDAPLLTSGS